MDRVRSAAALVAVALLAAGCASTRPAPAPPPSPPPTAAAPAEPAPVPAAAAPWEIPPELLDTQRLYRIRYQGPEGEGGLRLTLELDEPERYRARAVDVLGRPLWSLRFDGGGGGLWVDHRADVYCRLQGHADLSGLARLALAPFPLASLPPLLLGRLPARPAPGEDPSADGATVAYRDAEGRRWTAALTAGGAPESWALWGESVAGGPLVTWLAAGGEAVLSDRDAGIQLRWREVVAEPLAEAVRGAPGPVEPPGGYREVTCTEAAAAADGRRFDSFPPRL